MTKLKDTLNNAEIIMIIERLYGEAIGTINAIDAIVEDTGEDKIEVPDELMLGFIDCLQNIEYLSGIIIKRNTMLDNSPETHEAIRARKFSKDILESITKSGLQDVSEYLRVYQDKDLNKATRALAEIPRMPKEKIDREGNIKHRKDNKEGHCG